MTWSIAKTSVNGVCLGEVRDYFAVGWPQFRYAVDVQHSLYHQSSEYYNNYILRTVEDRTSRVLACRYGAAHFIELLKCDCNYISLPYWRLCN